MACSTATAVNSLHQAQNSSSTEYPRRTTGAEPLLPESSGCREDEWEDCRCLHSLSRPWHGEGPASPVRAPCAPSPAPRVDPAPSADNTPAHRREPRTVRLWRTRVREKLPCGHPGGL